MHVLVISTTYPHKHNPTSGIFFQHQASALKRAGFKVGVIAPILLSLRLIPQGLFRFDRGMTIDNEDGIPVFRYYQWAWLSQVKKGNLFLWEKAAKRLFEKYIILHGKPDIVHAQEAHFAGVFALQIRQQYGVPYILTEHNTMYARGLVKDWQLPGIKEVFRNAEKRVVVSPQLGAVLEAKLGSEVLPWLVIPNILDPLFSDHLLILKDSRANSFRFLNIAIMTEKKGQFELLEAFSRNFKGMANVELRLGGDGPLRKDLQRLANRLGIEPQVHFLGMLSRKQVLEEMQGCDVFVLPSHYETFGVVLIESLACGKPVISTACGGPESVINNNNGLIVPSKDIEALGKGLIHIYQNRSEYDSHRIRKECLEKYSEEVIARKLKDLFVDVKQMANNKLG